MRHNAEWWSARVAEFAATGDARAVARQHGVRERTLIWWRSELRRRQREAGTPAAVPRLLPVVVGRGAPLPAGACGGIELVVELGRARVTVRGVLTAKQLAAVVTASARAC